MNNYTESIESDELAVGTVTGLYRPGPFRRSRMLSLLLISTWFLLTTASAQTGLPLNFSPLSNPLPAPQSYYLDSDPNIPLADKTPLILIHGIDLFSGTPSASASGWDNFCIWYYSTSSIKNRFKIYRFAYQSNQNSVQTLGNYLAQLLNANDGSATDQQLAAKDIVILSHSMGGLVARRFMEEQRQTKAAKWNQSALRLVTLATPHHGTPAANRCDYVLDPLPDYIGALGYKLGHELGTVDFAILAAGLSFGNGIFHAIPTYNQPNRLDLLWDNYDGFFTSGFSPDELNPPTATLNSISTAQSYDSKIVAYAGNIANGSIIHSGHDGYLSATADILANGLGIPSDGIVPIASAWFQGRLGNSQIRFFDDYDHYQMMHSKTIPGDLPSLTDPLFTMIGTDLINALPTLMPPTISSVSPPVLTTSSSPQLITITGSNFLLAGDPNASSLVFYDPGNNPYPRTPINVTSTSMQYNINVQSASGTWQVKVVNGSVESSLYTFTVATVNAQLTGLSISGPANVMQNTSGNQYTARAIMSDGSTPTVTPTWSLSGGAPASISSSGQLTANSVGANTAITVTASYTYGGVTKTANYNVIISPSSSCGTYIQDLISNGTFAGGSTGWALTGNFQADSRFSACHSCPGYAYLANSDGSAGNNLNGTLSQTVTIPANATSATLGYYYYITTQDSSTVAYDYLYLNLVLSGGTLVGLDQKSNKDASSGYVWRSFDITAYRGQTISVRFTATTDASLPTVFRVDDVSLVISAPNPVIPVLFGVGGPKSVPQNTTAQYNAIVVNCDNSVQPVTPSWSISSGPASISSSGLLTAGSVSADTPATVHAIYNGTPLDYPITVVHVAPVYTSLSISGPSAINDNSSTLFTASAIYSDGTSQAASPTWSVTSGPGTISASGLLTIGQLSANATVTVFASYTTGGTTKTASQNVNVTHVPPPPTLASLSISGPSSLNENSTALYSATAFFSDGSSQVVIPTWSDNSSAASISTFGLLTAGEVASDTPVTISASYAQGGITRTAQESVTVINLTVTPTKIISLSGNLIFGNVVTGSVAQSTMTISNTGNTTMTITNVSYPSGFSGSWYITIAAGSSEHVTVTFSPTSATNYGGTVTVTSDATSGVNTIPASGTGTTTPSDTTPPALAITSPANNAVVTNANLPVTGTASDSGHGGNGISSVTVNGISASGGTASGSATANWNATITLTPGANTVTVVAYDTLNNATQQQFSVTYNAPAQTNIVFSDDFNDNVIDTSKWATSGNTVVESGGMMQVLTTVTDQGGLLNSVPIPIDSTGDITVTRNVLVHYANNNYVGDICMKFGNAPWAAVFYANATYNGTGDVPRYGTYIGRNSGAPDGAHFYCISASYQTTMTAAFPVLWDTWFSEKIVYSPTTGYLQYFVNGQQFTNYFIGIMPATNTPTMQFGFRAWGWFTGHQELFDGFLVTQTAPAGSQVKLTGMSVSNRVFRFVLNGPVGSNYVVKVTTNLVDWSPLATNTISGGGWVIITDPATTNMPRRFYRAAAP